MPNEEDYTDLPKSVLKQQQAAEKAMKDLSTPPGNTDEPAEHKPAPEPKPEVVKNPEPAQQSAPAIPTASADEDTYQQRYRVLKGKYDAETKQLRDKMVDLEATLKRQEQVIQDMNAQKSAPQSTPVDDLKDIDPEEYESWGTDIQSMAKQMNALKAIIRDQQVLISGLNAPTTNNQADPELLNRVESLEARTRKQTVEDYKVTLDRECPDWVRLNTDQGFNDWLDIEDPVSMRLRRDIIGEAASNYRGSQVANIFNAYLRETAPTSQQSQSGDFFSSLPETSGRGQFDNNDTNNGASIDELNKAQDDFVKGRITEEEYDAISASYQKNLGRQ